MAAHLPPGKREADQVPYCAIAAVNTVARFLSWCQFGLEVLIFVFAFCARFESCACCAVRCCACASGQNWGSIATRRHTISIRQGSTMYERRSVSAADAVAELAAVKLFLYILLSRH